jgi:mono/diheme cytochrome c family protein
MGASEQKRAACQGFALARTETGRVFAPHVLAFTGDPAESSSGYGGGSEGREAEVFHVPVIDEDAGRVLGSSKRLSSGLEGIPGKCALPRAAVVGKAGLFVTCLGDDVVALFDADALNPHELSLGRWSVPSGPTGIALDEKHSRAVVWSQFAHAITNVAIGDGSDTPRPFALSSVTLPRDTRASAKLERGRALFHATGDDRISSDGRACASCHPDGRDDTLVWSSPNGPRQTPMLAGRLAGAAPYGWNGDAADVSTHLVQTFKRLGGKGITGDDKDALMAYVSSLRAPPARKAKDPEAVLRGQAIFRSPQAECSSCHGSDGDLPDGVSHDVKSRTNGDQRTKFDTPSLRFVSGSGPYFHDGRYKDLHTLLTKSDGKMGHTKHLTPSELADLEAYLESM